MGHTILAHSLYACNQIDFDPTQIFSSTGDAHLIWRLNSSQLDCYHPDLGFKDSTLLLITADDWYEILRKIFSYNKYYQKFPGPANFAEFGCVGFENLNPLEWLTTFYYDYSSGKPVRDDLPILTLGDYLHNQLKILQDVLKDNLGWEWNQAKSDYFYSKMIDNNSRYLTRMYFLRDLVEHTKQRNQKSCVLEFWEKAIVISKCCRSLDIHPGILHWDDFSWDCNDNHSLISLLNRIDAV
jgi:hypothetical protein